MQPLFRYHLSVKSKHHRESVLLRIYTKGNDKPLEHWIRRVIVKRKDGAEEIIDAVGGRQSVKREDGVAVVETRVRGYAHRAK